MRKYRNSETQLPVYCWAVDNKNEIKIEDTAKNQIINIASLPFAFHHIAIMPDCHSGYGMPIGGVLATKGVIIPNAVGVDIGCGMCAVKTSLKIESLNKEMLKKMMHKIREIIPVGNGKHGSHKEKQDERLMPSLNSLVEDYIRHGSTLRSDSPMSD